MVVYLLQLLLVVSTSKKQQKIKSNCRTEVIVIVVGVVRTSVLDLL